MKFLIQGWKIWMQNNIVFAVSFVNNLYVELILRNKNPIVFLLFIRNANELLNTEIFLIVIKMEMMKSIVFLITTILIHLTDIRVVGYVKQIH